MAASATVTPMTNRPPNDWEFLLAAFRAAADGPFFPDIGEPRKISVGPKGLRLGSSI
jgi:hypothetical protein